MSNDYGMLTYMLTWRESGNIDAFSWMNSGTKMAWLELGSLTVEEAERKIKEEMPWAEIHVVHPNSFVTMDYKPNRVRIYVDSSGKVVRALAG